MKLTEINVYPVKSLKGISLQESKVENRGLQYDRRWMLVDKNNEFLTQREFPKMATLRVETEEKGLKVFDGENSISIPAEIGPSATVRVKVWSSTCPAKVYGDAINGWFSGALETDCRLVLMPEESRRRVNYFYAVRKTDVVSFADAYPFLLIGENSLNDLNSRLENPVPMNRFRPNLVVNESAAFAEDGWKKIKIGETVFHLVKPCARCVMTTIDQQTGVSDGKEPLKTLAGYRIPKRSTEKKILFGQNMIAENIGGVLRVGDRVEVLETKN